MQANSYIRENQNLREAAINFEILHSRSEENYLDRPYSKRALMVPTSFTQELTAGGQLTRSEGGWSWSVTQKCLRGSWQSANVREAVIALESLNY